MYFIKNKIFTSLILLVILNACQQTKNNIEYQAIGHFSNQLNLSTGAPRQGVLMPESKATIVLDNKFVGALSYLNDFEYIWVLYHFNQAIGWDSIVTPPESDHQYGLFATRSPRRPNPIGLSLIKLDSISNNILFVSGVDAFNKTPILDIKPFLPSIDYVVSEKNMTAELYLGHHDVDFINDTLVKKFVLGN